MKFSNPAFFLFFFLACLSLLAPGARLAGQSARGLNGSGFAHYEAGRFQEAIADFEKSLELSPDNQTVKRNLAFALRGLARKKQEEGDPDAAREALEKGLEVVPDDPYNHVEMANLDLKSNNQTSAQYHLGRATELAPENPTLLVTAARVYADLKDTGTAIQLLKQAETQRPSAVLYFWLAKLTRDQGDLDDSLYYADRGLELEPENSHLRELREKSRKENAVEGKMVRQKASHFTLSFDGEQAFSRVDFLLQCCEEAFIQVGQQLMWYPDHVTEVIVYRAGDYRSVTDAPEWSGGRYDGKLRIPLGKKYSDVEVRNTIFHEYTHMIVACLTGNHCPTWVNEGLAQLMEPEYGQLRAMLGLAKDYKEKGLKPTLEPGHEKPFNTLTDRDQVNRVYSLSYLGVYSLAQRFGIQKILEFLAEIKNRKEPAEALKSVFGLGYPDLGEILFEELKSFFKNRKPAGKKKGFEARGAKK